MDHLQSPSPLYTILGAGGIIAQVLTEELIDQGKNVRLVSRRPKGMAGVEEVAADLTDYEETKKAVKGSSIVVLCPGLKYDHKVWAASWPRIMRNTIDACKAANARLIFFDNVYMYGKVDGKMTEETPYNPTSKKGEVRASIALQLMDEVKAGNLTATIARSADFYGPYANTTGFLNILLIEKLKTGKKGMWFGNDDVPHSYTYTPDAGKGLWLLSTDEHTWNQIWHLPTAQPALTGKQYADIVASALGVQPRYQKLGSFMVRLGGLFNPLIREIHEMLYQNTAPYIFDSTKFEKHFNFQPCSYETGIRRTITAPPK